MSGSKDPSLYGMSKSPAGTTTKSGPRSRAKKEDIFSTHNRNTAKRAKCDLDPDAGGAFEQKHTTNGEVLESGVWQRSKRKMEEKAMLYAAMKRGDVEDADERYAVDFDRKWAENRDGDEEIEEDDDDDDDGDGEMVEYVDELGRNRTGTAAEAALAERMKRAEALGKEADDHSTARPSAPSNIIYGDTIQHQAFDPDEPIAAKMEALARKRDTSLTPPPETHFDANWEIRTKGTGFFQFSDDAGERKRQMENLERERAETERRREERTKKVHERKKVLEARRLEIQKQRGKRKAEEFLEELGVELGGRGMEQEDEVRDEFVEDEGSEEMMRRIDKAVEDEREDG
ncbi:hypothetical protein LTR78_000843 [Recurvomyces mirabilis]|uniref:Uncharacterized protein n=1 Tax=Recurvomyces mirabilis TaxID=574656 RepID=A0AAE1C5W1_9PEZI|nr:hypothetical protein LTR78_000843 [Recurvomyces mirabilis]KAK5158812.1 hypothetical protein LTS14_002920 [Recurvomyces mirabilis]